MHTNQSRDPGAACGSATPDHLAPIVFVVDDDASVRNALGRLLQSAELEARKLSSATEFLETEPVDNPSCLLLDVNLPDLSGLDLQRELALQGRDIPIIFITGFGSIPMSVRAMREGAVNFLEKPFRDEELLGAVHEALKRDARRRAATRGLDEIRAKLERLTPREEEVFGLVAQGLLNKQVASRLGTSVKTVKVHRGRVMRKMEAGSLAELVRLKASLDIGRESLAASEGDPSPPTDLGG